MNLRTRLLLGFGYLILLLLLTAGSAAVGFFQISEAIDQILEENFRSVSSAVEMLESLERQTTVTIEVMMTGEPGDFTDLDASFERHLAIARGNITIEGEAEALDRVAADYEEYRAVRDRIVASPRDRPMGVFRQDLFPRYSDVKEGVFELLTLNHEAIIAADENARRTALATAGWLGFLVTVSLVSMAFLARLLQRAILSRFDELTEAAESIIVGERSRRFEVSGHDELSVVARQLNAALDAQDELEAEMRGRLNQQKQLVLGMLEEFEGSQLLLGFDGQIIAATGVHPSDALVTEVRDWLQKERKAIFESFREERDHTERSVELRGKLVRVKLLIAGGRRPVGWLARFSTLQ
ncbi:MAG: HAMP domain-containing protein [Bradymonadaceae bacterium]